MNGDEDLYSDAANTASLQSDKERLEKRVEELEKRIDLLEKILQSNGIN